MCCGISVPCGVGIIGFWSSVFCVRFLLGLNFGGLLCLCVFGFFVVL